MATIELLVDVIIVSGLGGFLLLSLRQILQREQ